MNDSFIWSGLCRWIVLACCLCGLSCLTAQELAEAAPSSSDEKYAYAWDKAMNVDELRPEVAVILRPYFRVNFQDPEHWSEIESIRFDGRLHLADGSLSFVAFKKKPNLCKIVVYAGEQRVIMAYDGKEAWQLNTMDASGAVLMSDADARNFIRDAETGGNLLYPSYPGKRIRRLKDRAIDGVGCAILEVTRPDGEVVEYAIDLGRFFERQQVVTNAQTGVKETMSHSEFKKVKGVNIPFMSHMSIDGEPIHRVEMLRVQTNVGVVSWMFGRSAAKLVPGGGPYQPGAALSADFDPSFSSQEESSFDLPALDDAQRETILQELEQE
ncbi:hypothetical protein [Coraliomargarita akajimensis]|nr:hypothetical protein [Coraliomargarita akajimensis]